MEDSKPILGEPAPSFLQANQTEEDIKSSKSSKSKKTVNTAATKSKGPIASDKKAPQWGLLGQKNIFHTKSSDASHIYVPKSWEEPVQAPKLQRKISYVRLPGIVLRDEEDEAENLEKEIRAREIVNYLKDKWKLHISKKSSLTDIHFRTIDMLLHTPPSNHWFLKRGRQKIAERTGFFSDVRKPYEFMGIPEMDNEKIFFDNIPDILQISPDEWNEVQLRREQEKQRRNARLPHVPHLRPKRVDYTYGRAKRDQEGPDRHLKRMEKLVGTFQDFQKDVQGSYTKLWEEWAIQNEEDEIRVDAFGTIIKVESKDVLPQDHGSNGSSGGGSGHNHDHLDPTNHGFDPFHHRST